MKVLKPLHFLHMTKEVGDILSAAEIAAYGKSLDFYVRGGYLEKIAEKRTRVRRVK
jgi:hypothetical protein